VGAATVRVDAGPKAGAEGTAADGADMVTCPRCGNDADDLIEEALSLTRCEFCGDTIDATDPDLCDAVDGSIPPLVAPLAGQ
jgi:hypothetical protein